MFIFDRIAYVKESTLTYFCDCDAHLYNGLGPPSAYTTVVHLLTTAAFLVVMLVNYDFNYFRRMLEVARFFSCKGIRVARCS